MKTYQLRQVLYNPEKLSLIFAKQVMNSSW